MKGHAHDRIRRVAGSAVAGGLLLALLPGASSGASTELAGLPPCVDVAGEPALGAIISPWRAVLDGDGAVTGHRLTLSRAGVETTLHTGERSFTVRAGDGRVLVGERDASGTDLTMVDTRRVCQRWSRRLDRLVYPERDEVSGGALRLSTHDARTRSYRGTLALDVETGASTGLIDGQCVGACIPNDGDLTLAALASPGAARPVPSFAAGGWASDKRLPYRWRSGAVPPDWAKGPLEAAADDTRRTSAARTPRFVKRSDATNGVAYTGTLPGYCGSNAIACAGRSMPSYWGVWLRPHGTDYAWGTLRWCQKKASDGCFDIRRVLLHELGHIIGLNHPSSAGFTLRPGDSVMQAITPAKPKSGSSRHAFARCDVATLQELYDTPDNKTPISTCNDVNTRVTLKASAASVTSGGKVKLTAQLRAASRSAYRQLSGNYLNGRSLKLKYRRAGSEDSWKTLWMSSIYSMGRYELSIRPSATWEFKAVFPEPQDEGLRYSRSDIVKVKVKS